MDIYALGVIAMEIILREFPNASHEHRLPQIAEASQDAPEWEWLLNGCTSHDPAARLTSAGLCRELEFRQAARTRT